MECRKTFLMFVLCGLALAGCVAPRVPNLPPLPAVSKRLPARPSTVLTKTDGSQGEIPFRFPPGIDPRFFYWHLQSSTNAGTNWETIMFNVSGTVTVTNNGRDNVRIFRLIGTAL